MFTCCEQATPQSPRENPSGKKINKKDSISVRLLHFVIRNSLFYLKQDEKERKLASTTLSLLAFLAVEIQASAVELLTMMLIEKNNL